MIGSSALTRSSEDSMWVADQWQDFTLLDAGDGEKLERWGSFTIRRPDPQAIWPRALDRGCWERVDAWYHRSRSGGGEWEFRRTLPASWQIGYGDLRFHVKLTGFKHTALFPEQAVNWDWMQQRIRQRGGARVLNLFAYTGGATVACAAAGAEVVHLDASKGMTQLARENLSASGLTACKVRYLVDDAVKFVEREIRRGNHYDGMVLDPPSFGRGKSGEVWELEKDLPGFLMRIQKLLVPSPLFLVLNSYASGISGHAILNLVRALWADAGLQVASAELGLPIQARPGLCLPAGTTLRMWGGG